MHLAWLFQPTHDPDLTWQANAVELDWTPQRTGREALEAFLDGVRHGAGSQMTPLVVRT